jgi:hypothetical protein
VFDFWNGKTSTFLGESKCSYSFEFSATFTKSESTFCKSIHPDKAMANSNSFLKSFIVQGHSIFSIQGQSPMNWSTNCDQFGAQCQNFEHICTLSDSTVQIDFNMWIKCLDDINNSLQGINSSFNSIKLPASVIGNHDTFDTILTGDPGIVRMKDSLGRLV